MNVPETGTLIEGVGDELIHFVGLCLVVAIPLFIAYMNRDTTRVIHPENAAYVQQTRTRLGLPADGANQPAQAQGQFGATPGQSDSGQNGAANTTPTVPTQRYNVDAACPICLQEKECAAETNCGHVFCGNCLIAYWRHGTWLGAISCPVCRQRVTMILPIFQEGEENSDEGRRVSAEIRDYNRRFSGEPRPIMDYIYDLPMLLRHAVREFFTPHGFVWMFRFRILLCLVVAFMYLISPLDIIPEAVFGVLGFFDDIFVVLILLIYVSIIYRNIVAQRMMAD
ncbi:E3 ubiquitin-protein ligase RNF170-like [Diadema antillarum]|uniref:E3 ubiquitin-protein ligase RNF170-like n=1 Tax=Diadema antillarum TaxID=105358 RepID=UPI003A878583